MKKIVPIFTIVAAIVLLSMHVRAQSLITNTITSQLHSGSFAQGRDFWLAEMSNEWGINEGGAYLRLYITSPKNTTAYVSLLGSSTPVPIVANKVSSFLVPAFLEMVSSGIVEDKAIHVWSEDADLVVYNMNHNAYTTDGEYVIPTIGWGTDYVVAAYESYIDISEPLYDYPSEMAVVANQDSTEVTIIPSCNCRQCTGGAEDGNAQSYSVVYHAGQPANFTLNQGQDVELMPVEATGYTGFDLSGTIVHATKPVGVLGGSMETNIPPQFPYADRVEEMIPPIRSWGETYYTTNFHQVVDTLPKHDSAMYLFIASQPNQTILHSVCGGSVDTVCTIAKQYGTFWAEEWKAQKFWSNQPFLCVEYSNSATYPDGKSGAGDPSEVIINPRENFLKTVPFSTPTSGNSYFDYANITVNLKDIGKTLVDGKPLSRFKTVQCLDSNWEMVVDDSLSLEAYSGSHFITGDDSGVGVTVYGYGFDETYSWSSPEFEGTYKSPDTVGPRVDTVGACYQTTIFLSDSGMLPDGIHRQSGLAEIRLDSDYNMTYSGEIFLAGSGADTASYGMYVTDITKPAILIVDVFDEAGNETVVTSTYKPLYDSISPYSHNLGGWAGGPPAIGYDTIYNKGEVPFPLDELRLTNDSAGFAIFDSIGGPLDLSAIPVGRRRIVQIQFDSVTKFSDFDTLLAGNSCSMLSAILTGFGSSSAFTVSNTEWYRVPFPAADTGYLQTVTISNYLPRSIIIDSARWRDTAHFKAVTTFPVTVAAAPGKTTFEIAYFPDSNSILHLDTTQGTWYSHDVLEPDDSTPSPRFDKLSGLAAAPLIVSNSVETAASASLQTSDGRMIQAIVPSAWMNPVRVDLLNILGQTVYSGSIPGSSTFDAGALPRGVYFWRVESSGQSQIGKILLGE